MNKHSKNELTAFSSTSLWAHCTGSHGSIDVPITSVVVSLQNRIPANIKLDNAHTDHYTLKNQFITYFRKLTSQYYTVDRGQ
jgi:hypothetical protein